MILADKIMAIRKRNGWSQEELAEKLKVTRQSVSKWESTASIPDINKIIEMSKIFGVTTDYLLKDDVEDTIYSDKDETDNRVRVSIQEANDYIKSNAIFGRHMAVGVTMCILSPVLLILLSGAYEENLSGLTISEGAVAGIGVAVLLIMVAAAVAIFITSSMKMKRFDYLEKVEFEFEYGVSGIIREKMAAFGKKYTGSIVTGVMLCILSVVPLVVAGATGAADIVLIALVAILLAINSIAVFLFVSVGTVKSGFDRLLCEGEYDSFEERKRTEKFSGVYWPLVVAVYLCWSFITKDWSNTWIVWPIAGLIYVGISALLKK